MAQRYLRLRIDLNVNEPLLAGFKHTNGDGGEIWVQFRFEKLYDFCFKCRILSHIIEHCSQESFKMVMLKEG